MSVSSFEHANGIDCITLNEKTQKQIVAGTQIGEVLCHDVNNRTLLWRLEFNNSKNYGIGAVCFHPENEHLLFFALGNKLLQLDTRVPTQAVNPPVANLVNQTVVANDEVNSLDICPEGTLIALSDDDGIVHILDIESTAERRIIHSHDNICSSVMFSPYAENELFSGGLDCCIKSWDIDTGVEFWNEPMQSLASKEMMNPPMVHGIDCPRQASWPGLIAAARGDGAIFLKLENENDESTAALLHCEESGHTLAVSDLAFSKVNDGDKIFSIGNDKKVILWSWASETNVICWQNSCPDKPNALITRVLSGECEELYIGCQSGIYQFTIH